jgi:thiol-disulfide isomerase/thioredoxin
MRLKLQRYPLLRNAMCILAWLIVPSALAQQLIFGADLAADAVRARALHAPVLVFFSESWCPWCERVRREYLAPMQNDPAYRDRVLIREVDAGSDAPLTDFAGRATTQREFARRFKVGKVPVVIALGPDGEELAAPMVGMALPDFYQSYLDDAIDTGRRKLGAVSR